MRNILGVILIVCHSTTELQFPSVLNGTNWDRTNDQHIIHENFHKIDFDMLSENKLTQMKKDLLKQAEVDRAERKRKCEEDAYDMLYR